MHSASVIIVFFLHREISEYQFHAFLVMTTVPCIFCRDMLIEIEFDFFIKFQDILGYIRIFSHLVIGAHMSAVSVTCLPFDSLIHFVRTSHLNSNLRNFKNNDFIPKGSSLFRYA